MVLFQVEHEISFGLGLLDWETNTLGLLIGFLLFERLDAVPRCISGEMQPFGTQIPGWQI